MSTIQTTTDEHLLLEILQQDLSPEVTEMFDRFTSVLVAIDVMRESAHPELLTDAVRVVELESGHAFDHGDAAEIARLERALRYLKDECCEPVRH